MKLSNKEMDLIGDIEKNRKQRKIGAWISLLLIPITWSMEPRVSGFVTAAVIMNLIHVYIGVRPDDTLTDLLRRYLNADSEAIQQLSDNSRVNKSPS